MLTQQLRELEEHGVVNRFIYTKILEMLVTPKEDFQRGEMCMNTIEYREICPSEIDLIKPLWEELIRHHMGISVNFKNSFKIRTFEDRKKCLLANSRWLKIWGAEDIYMKKTIGYCISSISGEEGEIDSLFVSDQYRGKNIGRELMNRSLDWLYQNEIENIKISVLYENEKALQFYEKFDFVPRNYTLKKRS